MAWPYIAKEMVNVGTLEEPVFQAMPKVIYIPGKGQGPWQFCRDCRAGHKENPKFKMNHSIMGSGRCLKHILRFHKANGTLTPELKLDLEYRNEVHVKQRAGAYYLEDRARFA